MSSPTRLAKIRDEQQPLLTRTQDRMDALVRPFATALARTPIMGVAPVWTAFPLTAPLANIGGAFATAAYYKDAFFRVWTKGVLTSAAGCAAGTIMGIFPPGFIPGEQQRFAVEGNAASAQFINVSPNGLVWNEVLIAPGGSIDFAFSFLAER